MISCTYVSPQDITQSHIFEDHELIIMVVALHLELAIFSIIM